MNPNEMMTRLRAMSNSSSSGNANLHQYMDWVMKEYPESLVFVITNDKAMPTLGKRKILRGDRKSVDGWCVIQSPDFENTIIITRKEYL